MSGALCPWCGAANDTHDGADPTDRPSNDDTSICYRCRRVSLFVVPAVGPVGFRKPTEEEQAAIQADPRVTAALDALAGPLEPEAAVAHWRERLPR